MTTKTLMLLSMWPRGRSVLWLSLLALATALAFTPWMLRRLSRPTTQSLPASSSPPEQMAEDEEFFVKDEAVIVRSWRLENFLKLGFELRDASILTKRHDIELRKAERILNSGASHEETLRILL